MTYAFEHGRVRLNQKDYDAWAKAYPHLDLRAELTMLADSPWLERQDNWFYALSCALNKRNTTAQQRKGMYHRMWSDEYPWKKPTRSRFERVPEDQREMWRRLHERKP